MKELIIKIKWGGLGDHLLHSPLPRIAKQKFEYDKVFISNHSDYCNLNTKRLVWEYNPFVDGYSDKDGSYPQFGNVSNEKNLLDGVVDFYNLDDGERFREPEIYYKPKNIPRLNNAIIFEPNHSSAYGIPSQELVDKYFAKNIVKRTHQMISLHGNALIKDLQVIVADSLEEFCDVISSCKAFFCFTSGAATLSAALGKSTTVLFIEGINPMFHHSKLHIYIKL